MAVFDPLRDFYRRRQAAKFDRLVQGLQIQIEHSKTLQGNFFFPGSTFTATILRDGQPAGHVRYGQSPLKDRVYISDFNVRPEQRRQGVGQGALWRLWCLYQVPLTPMHEVGTSIDFWQKVRRRFAGAGVELTQDIRTGDQNAEQARWKHLIPESEAERSIREYWEWVAAEHAAGRPAGPGIR